MSNKQVIFWKAFPALSGGAFIGLLVLITLRVQYFHVMDYQPNMGSQIAYYFVPILLALVLIIALPLEVLFRKYFHSPYTKIQALIIGMGYATALIWWAFPSHWEVFVVINPLTIRWIMGLIMRPGSKQD